MNFWKRLKHRQSVKQMSREFLWPEDWVLQVAQTEDDYREAFQLLKGPSILHLLPETTTLIGKIKGKVVAAASLTSFGPWDLNVSVFFEFNQNHSHEAIFWTGVYCSIREKKNAEKMIFALTKMSIQYAHFTKRAKVLMLGDKANNSDHVPSWVSSMFERKNTKEYSGYFLDLNFIKNNSYLKTINENIFIDHFDFFFKRAVANINFPEKVFFDHYDSIYGKNINHEEVLNINSLNFDEKSLVVLSQRVPFTFFNKLGFKKEKLQNFNFDLELRKNRFPIMLNAFCSDGSNFIGDGLVVEASLKSILVEISSIDLAKSVLKLKVEVGSFKFSQLNIEYDCARSENSFKYNVIDYDSFWARYIEFIRYQRDLVHATTLPEIVDKNQFQSKIAKSAN